MKMEFPIGGETLTLEAMDTAEAQRAEDRAGAEALEVYT